MLMQSRLVGERVVHLGCQRGSVFNHLNRKRPHCWGRVDSC